MTRRFDGDRAALTGIRLRLLVRFLWRRGLYDTFHALSRETGAFFMPTYLKLVLLEERWDDALAYVMGFIVPGSCSPEADMLAVRIHICAIMRKLGVGEVSTVAAAFDRLEAALLAYPDCHAARRTLLSMRHDVPKASRLYQRIRPTAEEVIMKLASNCPELKSKMRLPRCTFDPTYIMSLGPRLWDRKRARKNVPAGRIPARVLARSFLRNRSPPLTLQMKHSGVSARDANPSILNQGHPLEPSCRKSAPALQVMLPIPAESLLIARTTNAGVPALQAMLPIPTENPLIARATNTDLKRPSQQDVYYPERFQQNFYSRNGAKRLRTTGEFSQEADTYSDTLFTGKWKIPLVAIVGEGSTRIY